jgi:PKD domain
VSVTVSDGSQVSEPAHTSVEVLPALEADSLSVAPTCGAPGNELTLRGMVRGANAGVVDGGWDLTRGLLAARDVEITLPWAIVLTAPSPATLAFETKAVVPAGLAPGAHVVAAGAASATFTTPCPPAGNLRPIADAGGPEYTGAVGEAVRLDGSRSRDPEGDALTYSWSFGDGTSGTGVTPHHVYERAGRFYVSLVVDDGHQQSGLEVGTHSFARVVVTADHTAPTTTATREPVPNPQGWNHTDVTVRLTAADDDGGSGVKELVYRLSGAQSGGQTVAGASTSVRVSAEGETNLSYFARDKAGNVEAEKTLTVRIDRTAPTLTCSASPSVLWPPNHRLVQVSVSVDVQDALAGPGTFVLADATSSEPDEGLGDGDTRHDIQGFEPGTADTSGSLRAERSGRGSGRTYGLIYRGADAAGSTAACTARVRVPH